MKNKILFLFIFAFFSPFLINAQDGASSATYWFGGVNTRLGQKHNLFAYYGFSPDDHFTSGVIIPYFRLTKNIHFSPTYMVLKTNHQKLNPFQHHFMPSLTLQFKPQKNIIIADRNMYFSVVMKDQKATSFYRNRLGVTYITKVAETPMAFFINDAVFWNLRTKKFFRNRLGMGVSVQWKKWVTPQFMYILQNEPGFFPKHQFYFALTVPLQNYGIFNKQKKPKDNGIEVAPPVLHDNPQPVISDF